MSDNRQLNPLPETIGKSIAQQDVIRLPRIIRNAGAAAHVAWDEFFEAQISNNYTRKNYSKAVRRFLAGCEQRNLELIDVTPGDVGKYVQMLPLAVPTKLLHLAALRRFFDRMVNRHVVVINPAATVRGERYSVIEGKTPEIKADQARALLASIDTTTIVGMRDRAVLAILIYTAARVGAVAKLRMTSLVNDGTQYLLRFAEKGGKSREIPVRHDVQKFLLDYLQTAKITAGPLFPTAIRKTNVLTSRSHSGNDICRMMKRRLKDACLPTHFSPHSFRVATVTNLLEQNQPLEDVQFIAGHADPRTTRLYDRRGRKVTRNLVERLSI